MALKGFLLLGRIPISRDILALYPMCRLFLWFKFFNEGGQRCQTNGPKNSVDFLVSLFLSLYTAMGGFLYVFLFANITSERMNMADEEMPGHGFNFITVLRFFIKHGGLTLADSLIVITELMDTFVGPVCCVTCIW